MGRNRGGGLVTPQELLNYLLSIHALLLHQGGIPSLTGLQHKLITAVEQLYCALHKQEHASTQIENLCCLICLTLDNQASMTLRQQGLSWENYRLWDHFSRKGEPSVFRHPVAEQALMINTLLNSQDREIVRYTQHILALSECAPPCPPTETQKPLPLLCEAPPAHQPLAENHALPPNKWSVAEKIFNIIIILSPVITLFVVWWWCHQDVVGRL